MITSIDISIGYIARTKVVAHKRQAPIFSDLTRLAIFALVTHRRAIMSENPYNEKWRKKLLEWKASGMSAFV